MQRSARLILRSHHANQFALQKSGELRSYNSPLTVALFGLTPNRNSPGRAYYNSTIEIRSHRDRSMGFQFAAASIFFERSGRQKLHARPQPGWLCHVLRLEQLANHLRETAEPIRLLQKI